MPKIVLGQPPKSFDRTVKFLQVNGQPGQFNVKYKYRTRDEFGQFIDTIRDDIMAEMKASLDRIEELSASGQDIPDVKESESLARQDAANVRYIMGSVDSWDLDVPFSEAAVAQLANEVPAAVVAVLAGYRAAVLNGATEA